MLSSNAVAGCALTLKLLHTPVTLSAVSPQMKTSVMPASVPSEIVAKFWPKLAANNCLNTQCLLTGVLKVDKAFSFSNSPSQDPVDAARTEAH